MSPEENSSTRQCETKTQSRTFLEQRRVDYMRERLLNKVDNIYKVYNEMLLCNLLTGWSMLTKSIMIDTIS